jgi:hypothetical protein
MKERIRPEYDNMLQYVLDPNTNTIHNWHNKSSQCMLSDIRHLIQGDNVEHLTGYNSGPAFCPYCIDGY